MVDYETKTDELLDEAGRRDADAGEADARSTRRRRSTPTSTSSTPIASRSQPRPDTVGDGRRATERGRTGRPRERAAPRRLLRGRDGRSPRSIRFGSSGAAALPCALAGARPVRLADHPAGADRRLRARRRRLLVCARAFLFTASRMRASPAICLYTRENVAIAVLLGDRDRRHAGLLSARFGSCARDVDPIMMTAGTVPILVAAPFLLIWFGVGRASAVLPRHLLRRRDPLHLRAARDVQPRPDLRELRATLGAARRADAARRS